MTYLSHVQTLSAGQIPNFSLTARMEIDPGTGHLLIHDPVTQTLARAVLGPGTLSRGSFSQDDRAQSSDKLSFDFKGTTRTLDRTEVARVIEDGEGSAYLDGVGFYGLLTTLAAAEVGGRDYLYLARKSGYGLEAYRAEGTGLTPLQILGDTAESHLRAVTGLTTLREGGQDWLVAASSAESGISLYRIGTDGRLSHGSAFGFAEQLPATTPTGLTSVTLDGHSYVLMTAYGTSSLTVLELTGGTLAFRDQVNDSLDTRFQGASVMATWQEGDLALVAVAGNDGGLSLFQLLPGGRLIHRETVVDTLTTALDRVTALEFAPQSDGTVDLLAFAVGDGGITRFQVDDGALGITATGRTGTGGNDVLTAGSGGTLLQGGHGDDVLLDGTGRDTLWGGAGEDIFVFRPDGVEDRIGDFDPLRDTLDLSGFDGVHDISALSWRQTSGGAVITVAGEDLVVYTASGTPLGHSALRNALMLSADHVLMPRALPQTGTGGNDLFEIGMQADTIDGGAGYDTVSYTLSPAPVQVDLAGSSGSVSGGGGQRLTSVEGLIGSAHNDRITGDAMANTLSGGAGHDTILAGDGADWITPGAGSNVVDGGAGRDMVSFVDLADTPGRTNMDYRLDINLSTGRAVNHDGSETNTLTDIERVTGTIFADRIRGDGADNELRGLGDYDWFVGTRGNDTYDGGTGRDMISYVGASAGVTVDLAAGLGTRGLALGDSYTSIERVTGSGFADLFYGDSGENDFRGLGGYDTFVGSSGGRERYDGGSGSDTVTYFLSTSGIEASLLRGYGSRGDAARDLYTSIENLGGTSFDDVLTGDHGRNNLRGLGGDDFIFGNGGIDYITGGRGDDTIDGGDGSDYAVFSGDRSGYRLHRDGDSVTVSGTDGTDLLTDVEYFRFDDMTLRIWDL